MSSTLTRCFIAAALALPAMAWAQSLEKFHFPTWDERDETAGAWPEVVAVADVTGDGRKDVVVGTSEYGATDEERARFYKLFVYVQQNDGTLSAPVITPHGGTGRLRMQAGDLDRDGRADIVVSHLEGVSIARSRGDGTFDISVLPLAVGGTQQALALGDLNGDRKLDIVRQPYEWNANLGTELLFGDGLGGILTRRNVAANAGWHQGLRIGDVTGDKVPDLVMSNNIELRVLPGRGNGMFHAARVQPYHNEDNARGYWGLAILDVDADGRRDVVTTTAGNPPNGGLYIFQQQPDGRLPAVPRELVTYDMAETTVAVDLDHNGYEDLLVLHGGWYRLGVYFQDASGLGAEKGVWVPYASHYNPHGMDTGDVNGDGCTDVAVADYNNELQILHGRNCFEPWAIATDDPGDFDGDGASDIFWRSSLSGQNVLWRSGRSGTRSPMRRVADRDWHISGTGDFDGDGRSDLFWRHAVTGSNAIWRAADQGSSVAVSRVGDLDWEVAGIGDLDGDGRDDLVWRHRHTGANRIWDGGAGAKARAMTAVTDIDWRIVGVADFDADGRDDILWRHRGDGRNVIWRGGGIDDLRTMPAVADNAWQVAGVADFDADGRSDVLWRHSYDGRLELWPAADQHAARPLAGMADVSWKVVGVSDYSGDGRADILWRNLRTGSNTIWRDGDGSNRQAVGRVSSLEWTAVR